MRCYAISPSGATAGITLTEGRLVLGEVGRGRTAVDVPLPEGSVVEVGRVVDLAIDGRGAVVRIPNLSGFRGSWGLYAAPTPAERRRVRAAAEKIEAARAAIRAAHVPGMDVCAPTAEYAAAGRVFDAAVTAHKELKDELFGRPHALKVVAFGVCADGIAGRMGGGEDILLVMRPGEAALIRRSGRLYDSPARLIVRCTPAEEVEVHNLDALDATEAAAEKLAAAEDATDTDMVPVEIRFGSPNRRARAAGFWNWPVVVRDQAGTEIGRISPHTDRGWVDARATGSCTLLGTESDGGHDGGWVTISLAVPFGATASHEWPASPEPMEQPAAALPSPVSMPEAPVIPATPVKEAAVADFAAQFAAKLGGKPRK